MIYNVFSICLSRDEFHAEPVGALVEVVEQALAISFFVVVLALAGVFLALGAQRVDQTQTRELVTGGGTVFGLSMRERNRQKYAPKADCLVRKAAAFGPGLRLDA